MKFKILIFFLTGVSTFSQNSNCDKFKTGVFIDTVKELSMSVKVTRDKNFQYEDYKDGGMSIKLKVEWIDSCSYKLVFIKGNEAWNKKFGKTGNPDLIVNILETGEDYYIQESNFVDSKEKPFRNRMQMLSN